MRSPGRRLSSALSVLVLLGGAAVARTSAESSGSLTARVQDRAGQPLARVLVSFLGGSDQGQLPILARTDGAGLVLLKDIGVGSYRVLVRSSKYRLFKNTEIDVSPGRTEFVTVVLQHLLGTQVSQEENLGLKAFMRANRRKLIFKTQPGTMVADLPDFPARAVMRVYANSGFGGDYQGSPSDSPAGTTTNFAFASALGFNGTSVLAGQINSGRDSYWRLRNQIDYQFGEHNVQVLIGFGQLRYDRPSVGALSEAFQGREDAAGRLRTLSFGMQDGWSVGDNLSLEYGFEVNRVQAGETKTYLSPNARFAYSPFRGTQFQVVAASKRLTQNDSIELPGGESVNLADAIVVSRIGDRFSVGTTRYYRAGVSQSLGKGRSLEFTAFDTDVRGATRPFAVRSASGSDPEVLQLDGAQNKTSGFEMTFAQDFSENLKAALTYINARAVGLDSLARDSYVDVDSIRNLMHRSRHHAVSARIDAYLPVSQTSFTTLINVIPEGRPVPTLDPFSDVYETSNEGVHVFVRQVVPMPQTLFGLLGLDFLAKQRIEALIDIRNLTNEDVGTLRTSAGEVALVRNPRSVRGGISLKF